MADGTGADDPTRLNETISSSIEHRPVPVVHDHVLIRKIGAGAYGEVWLARNVLGAFRAVKVVYRDSFRDARPFEREFSGIQKYEPISRTHPGMVSILHVGRNEADQYFYYIMEIADDLERGQTIDANSYIAKTLAAEIGRHGKPPLEKFADISKRLGSALEHLHTHGLIHRDIKPANIIFVKGEAKLADIGLVTDSEEAPSFAGSPGYMPPEGPGAQADIFSLGKVLYELVTGNRCDQYPEFPPGEPQLNGIKQVLLKACELDPRKRYRTAKELRLALEAVSRPELASRSRALPLVLAGASALVLIAFLISFFVRDQRPSVSQAAPQQTPSQQGATAAVLDKRKLAVLPFQNISPKGEEFDYFAEGITDQIITRLSNASGLSVKASPAVAKYKTRQDDLPAIARELGVGSILVGRVSRDGTRMLVTTQLVDVQTQENRWGKRFDRTFEEVLTVETEVAERVVENLEVILLPREQASVSRRPTGNSEAYDKYLKASFNFGPGPGVADRSIPLLREAVALDGSFAEAWALLSLAYSQKAYWDEAGDALWESLADKAAATALELNQDLAQAHLARGRCYFRGSNSYNFESALSEFRQAISLRPNLDEGHYFLGSVCYHVGLLDESRRFFDTSADLNPTNSRAKRIVAEIEYMQGNYQTALKMFEAELPNLQDINLASSCIALRLLGRTDEAVARIDKALKPFQANPGDKSKDRGGILTATKALLLALTGKKDEAHAAIAKALEIGKGFGHFHHTTHTVAAAYSVLGELDPALEWLRYTCTNGYPNVPWFRLDPHLENLRKDARFEKLMTELEPRREKLRQLVSQPLAK